MKNRLIFNDIFVKNVGELMNRKKIIKLEVDEMLNVYFNFYIHCIFGRAMIKNN